MKNVSIIAAIGKNNELGKNNDLIWHLKGDLQFFKNTTMGKEIIMGSKTFYSLPKLLPGRKHIVLTTKDIDNKEILLLHSKEELINYLKQIKEEVMIIGGANIYNQFIDCADKLYLTHIDDECPNASVFFPKINYNEWDSQLLGSNNDNGIKYKHIMYKRKTRD